MNLRSGNTFKLGAGSIRDGISKISSEESVIQGTNLDTILEDSLEFGSHSTSTMSSEGFRPFSTAGTSMKYNIIIEYYTENPFGAKIYLDPFDRYAVRIDDHAMELVKEVRVTLQGDRYADAQGTQYLIVSDP